MLRLRAVAPTSLATGSTVPEVVNGKREQIKKMGKKQAEKTSTPTQRQQHLPQVRQQQGGHGGKTTPHRGVNLVKKSILAAILAPSTRIPAEAILAPVRGSELFLCTSTVGCFCEDDLSMQSITSTWYLAGERDGGGFVVCGCLIEPFRLDEEGIARHATATNADGKGNQVVVRIRLREPFRILESGIDQGRPAVNDAGSQTTITPWGDGGRAVVRGYLIEPL